MQNTHSMNTRSRTSTNAVAPISAHGVAHMSTRSGSYSTSSVVPISTNLVVSPTSSHMITRIKSGTIRPVTYDVNIDFDEASDAWRSNKKSIGNGMFKYVGMRTRSSSKM